MPAIERDLFVPDLVLAQALDDPGYHFRCDVLVRASIDEGHPRGAQPTHCAVEGEVEIRRKLAAPQRKTIDLDLPHRDPSAHCGGALGIPQGVHCHTCPIEGPEHLRVHCIEVPHVVLDLGEAILSRHPACTDTPLRRTLAQIEPGQPLRGHEVAPPIVEHAQLLQESRRELAVSVAREPHLPRAGWVPQREITRGALDRDVVLLHVRLPPVRNAECGMRNGHPPFNSAFRIPHSAFRSLRWSRPRAARRRTGPFCPAPRAPGRPIRARRRAPDGRSSHSHRIATPPLSSGRSRCSSAAPGGSPAARASRSTARAPILRARCRPASAQGPGRRAARTRAAAGTRLPTARAARRRARARPLKRVRGPAPPESVPGIARAVWTWASPRDPVGSGGRRATARPPRATGSRASRPDWSTRTRRSPAPRARARVPRTPPRRTRAPAPCGPGPRAENPPNRRRPAAAPRCRTPSPRQRRCRGSQRASARASDATTPDCRCRGCSGPWGCRRTGWGRAVSPRDDRSRSGPRGRPRAAPLPVAGP